MKRNLSDDLMRLFPPMEEPTYEGVIKLRLAHARGFSVLLPDIVAIDCDGWRWFQPQFFSPCLLTFSGKSAGAQLGIDTDTGAQLLVRFTKDLLLRHCSDGSQVYRCRISGPAELARMGTGSCAVGTDGEIHLDLFHHTEPDTIRKIEESGYFLGSPWNVQGTRKLINVAYAYFTSLSAINSDDDLQRIAMATEAKIFLLPTNAISRKEIVAIDVYRQNTWQRRASMRVVVPAELIAPQHLYCHRPHGEPVYFEVCHPAIARVGLLPGHVLPLLEDRLAPVGTETKKFEYVVLGDADSALGLVAPYNEEETKALFFLERCMDESFFDYWHRNANSDQVSGRNVELQQFHGGGD